MNRPPVPGGIREPGVVAIARHLTPDSVRPIADGLISGGVRAFEITLNEPESAAIAVIEALTRHAEGSGLVVGAGTVLSVEAGARALDAGAQFLVMPHTDPSLVAWAAGRDVPALPGAMTPTEILVAWRAGASAVKLFPASVVGAGFIREFRGPFPDIPLLPTGGVTVETTGSFVRFGAIAVGLGSWLIGDGEPDAIADRARRAVQAVAEARETP